MQSHLKEIDLGSKTIYRRTIESDDCGPFGTPKCRFVQFELLRYLAEDPMNSACGFSDFQKVSMRYDSGRWIVEAEAIVDKPQSSR